ncbi:MAG: GNAT family N-acetyltransferase [Alphaproteobacteria bacterium]
METTERLALRRPRLADAPPLFRFLGDADAMRHTERLPSLRRTRHYLAAHERRRRRCGYAPWTIVERDGDRIVGWGGLYEDLREPGWGIEVVYFLAPDTWGRGYATELVERCVAVARDRLHLAEIVGFAHPDNIGSQRVMEKCGFHLDRFVPKMDRLYFRLPLAP